MAKRSYVLEGIIGSGSVGGGIRFPIIIVRASSFNRAAEKLGGKATFNEGAALSEFHALPGSLGTLAAMLAKHTKDTGQRNHACSNSTGALQLLKQCDAFKLFLLPVID
jgi:hypothetical protein